MSGGRVRRVPTRSCVACRTTRSKGELVRIVRMPSGDVRPDPGGRMAGRGAYVCQGDDCLTVAINRGALSRALKTPIPAELRAALLSALVPQNEHQGGARGQE